MYFVFVCIIMWPYNTVIFDVVHIRGRAVTNIGRTCPPWLRALVLLLRLMIRLSLCCVWGGFEGYMLDSLKMPEKMIEFNDKNNLGIASKPHAYLQSISKTFVKF